jgi:hypothetical protein
VRLPVTRRLFLEKSVGSDDALNDDDAATTNVHDLDDGDDVHRTLQPILSPMVFY